MGRSDNDRQFFFLNQRPVDLPKLTRVVNEVGGWVWRCFCFCFLSVGGWGGCVDMGLKDEAVLIGSAETNKRINPHNKVWRQYEMKHKPAAILNIEAPPGKGKNILGSALLFIALT